MQFIRSILDWLLGGKSSHKYLYEEPNFLLRPTRLLKVMEPMMDNQTKGSLLDKACEALVHRARLKSIPPNDPAFWKEPAKFISQYLVNNPDELKRIRAKIEIVDWPYRTWKSNGVVFHCTIGDDGSVVRSYNNDWASDIASAASTVEHSNRATNAEIEAFITTAEDPEPETNKGETMVRTQDNVQVGDKRRDEYGDEMLVEHIVQAPVDTPVVMSWNGPNAERHAVCFSLENTAAMPLLNPTKTAEAAPTHAFPESDPTNDRPTTDELEDRDADLSDERYERCQEERLERGAATLTDAQVELLEWCARSTYALGGACFGHGTDAAVAVLVARGLVRRMRRDIYEITPAGREALAKAKGETK